MFRYLITVVATQTGMPPTAPKTSPKPVFPIAQPINVPTAMHAAVEPISTLPAPARENVGRWGCTGAEHTTACDTGFPLLERRSVTFVTRSGSVAQGRAQSITNTLRRDSEDVGC